MASRRGNSSSTPPNGANRRRITSARLPFFALAAVCTEGSTVVVPRVPLCPPWLCFFFIDRHPSVPTLHHPRIHSKSWQRRAIPQKTQDRKPQPHPRRES